VQMKQSGCFTERRLARSRPIFPSWVGTECAGRLDSQAPVQPTTPSSASIERRVNERRKTDDYIRERTDREAEEREKREKRQKHNRR